jgi:signal transduction histidine kinase
LRRRAEALAGTLDLHSDAAGTRVTVDFHPSSQRGWRDRVRHWLRTARTLPHG